MIKTKKTCGQCAWIKKGICRKIGGEDEDLYVGVKGTACKDFLSAKK